MEHGHWLNASLVYLAAAVIAVPLARKLGLATDFITPGYEDSWYYLWRERKLPVNVDPFDSRLDDELERVRLRRVFSQGLEAAVGYVLPLQAKHEVQASGPRWGTGPWFFRDERMYLIPGDSPMGYRLPLDSLPWVAARDYPYHIEQDPSVARDALPAGATFLHQYAPHQFCGGFAEGGVVALTAAQLGYMLEGIDWRNPQYSWRPQSAG